MHESTLALVIVTLKCCHWCTKAHTWWPGHCNYPMQHRTRQGTALSGMMAANGRKGALHWDVSGQRDASYFKPVIASLLRWAPADGADDTCDAYAQVMPVQMMHRMSTVSAITSPNIAGITCITCRHPGSQGTALPLSYTHARARHATCGDAQNRGVVAYSVGHGGTVL